MEVSDVSALVNQAAKSFGGFEAVVQEDLSDILDFGRAIEDAMGFDVFFNKLVDQFNTIKFWSRPHVTFAPNVWMEKEKFGAIRAMYRTKYIESQPAEQWNLQQGVSYDPYVVNKQEVQARFWSKKFSSSLKPQTIVREQLFSAFRSESELMSFIGMLEMARTNSHRRAWDEQIMRLFQGIAAMAVNAGGMQDIQLLTEYNSLFSQSLTATNALFDEGFNRYAIYRMGIVRDQMRLVTGLFNSSHYESASSPERQKTVMLSDFARSAGVYLHDAPNQFNTGSLAIPDADIIPAWQGMGTSGTLADRMSVKAIVDVGGESPVTANVTGLLAIVYDEWALGVSTEKHDVRAAYNARGNYTNYFDDMLGGFFVSPDENVVVFRLV